jgi:hypothetical protein
VNFLRTRQASASVAAFAAEGAASADGEGRRERSLGHALAVEEGEADGAREHSEEALRRLLRRKLREGRQCESRLA